MGGGRVALGVHLGWGWRCPTRTQAPVALKWCPRHVPPPHTVMDGAPDTRYTGHALEGPATHRQEPRSVTGSHAAHWGRGKAAAMWRMVVIRPLPKPPWSLLKTMTNWSTEAPAARLLYTPQRRATETAPGRKRAPEDRSPSALVNQAARRRSLCGLCASRVPAP